MSDERDWPEWANRLPPTLVAEMERMIEQEWAAEEKKKREATWLRNHKRKRR